MRHPFDCSVYRLRHLPKLVVCVFTASCVVDLTSGSEAPPPGSSTEDLGSTEFPARLLAPWTGGPAEHAYDNKFITAYQLRRRIEVTFGDSWSRNGTDMWSNNASLFGLVDFEAKYTEERSATASFLLGVEVLGKDICGVAVNAASGPFSGLNVNTIASPAASLGTFYKRMLFRSPSPDELTSATQLLTTVEPLGGGAKGAWSALCEALLRHPDFLFTLPPSYSERSGDEERELLLVKVAYDLLGRPPTEAELTSVTAADSIDGALDAYLHSDEFRDYFYYKMKLRMESDNSELANEAARLWVYLALNDLPFSELFTADYTVDESFNKVPRPPEHGRTGILTMKGYIVPRPSLPHYNYSARVMSDFMGVSFTIPQSVLDQRTTDSTASSTVDPDSICYSCHKALTPLALQRQKWDNDGNYRATNNAGEPIDDSDAGIVEWYPFKGTGVEAFTIPASLTEAFQRTTINAIVIHLLGRPMRAEEDERVLYKSLWDQNHANGWKLRELIKVAIASPTYRAK